MARFVREIMNKNLIEVQPDDSVGHARNLMRQHRIHSVLIRPPHGGSSWRIFTETDLLIALESGDDPDSVPVAAYASPVTHKARPDWEYRKALQEMINYGVKHLPVVDGDGDVIGMISSTDMVNNY